jgi:hypothetical protein
MRFGRVRKPGERHDASLVPKDWNYYSIFGYHYLLLIEPMQ